MALLNKNVTVGSASGASDGILKKMAQKRKMKKAIKSQGGGEAKYSQPVRRTLKKVGRNIEDKMESARTGAMARKAVRQSKRTGTSDTCGPKGCKTVSPTKTF